MIRNLFVFYIRNLLRNKEFSLINIGGLAIGMCASLVILIWVQDELSFDRFHEDSDRIARVIWERDQGDQKIVLARTPTPLGELARSQLPQVENYFRYGTFVGEVLMRRGNQAFYETGGAFADPAIFSMLSIEFVAGHAEDAFSNPLCTVISESFAEKYFGSSNPVNQLIELENVHDLKVTGVFQDLPRNSHLQFDFLVPFRLQEMWGVDLTDWSRYPFYTYLLLREPDDFAAVDTLIRDLRRDKIQYSGSRFFLQPFVDVHLRSSFAYDDMAVLGDINLIYVFSLVGFFILILACINFVNLTAARSLTRFKEFGIRKVVGATPYQIRNLYFGEAMFQVSLAFLIALTCAELLSPVFGHSFGKMFHFDYLNMHFVLLLLLVLGISVLVCGIYPALLLPPIQPIDVLYRRWLPARRGLSLRRFLVVLQFSVSLALIICTFMIFAQLRFIRDKQAKFFQDDIISIQCRPGLFDRFPEFKRQLLENDDISYVTAASNFASYFPLNIDEVQWRGKHVDEDWRLYCLLADLDYFDTFGLEMVQGRSFTQGAYSDSAAVVVINETAAKEMGFQYPVGEQVINYDQEFEIIGVVRDYHIGSLYQAIRPLMIQLRNNYLVYIFVRVSSDRALAAIDRIEEVWQEYVPDFPFEYRLHGNVLQGVYRGDQRILRFFTYFAALALFLSCLGLYGLASFRAEQKTKEIGIRKVLGASSVKIVRLLTIDFAKSIFAACLIAWPLAYWVMHYWLNKFAYHIPITLGRFLIATGVGVCVALGTVSYQAIKAAYANPVDSLRYE